MAADRSKAGAEGAIEAFEGGTGGERYWKIWRRWERICMSWVVQEYLPEQEDSPGV